MVNEVINTLPSKENLMRQLIRNKLWVIGLIINFGVGTIFYLIAQTMIGPALIPGLMASGLIILAIGSVFILEESLKLKELAGIIIMVIAITFLGFSGLSIKISTTQIWEFSFLLRVLIFTMVIFFLSFIFEMISRKTETSKGIPLAIFSGNMFALSNLWVCLLIGTISKVFAGNFIIGELIIFIISAIILVIVNIYGIIKIQQAFSKGKAGNLVVIQQIPIQTGPIIIYFLVFLMPTNDIFSVIFLILAITLIIISAVLLGKRQAEIEQIG
ncbi:MAG: conserved membrane protein of unknown function [Promethearchaeota archaeon]|nr:MAG: conserved membrane protein of unknown function [Candidatus Lokiarchaeota archaeon]